MENQTNNIFPGYSYNPNLPNPYAFFHLLSSSNELYSPQSFPVAPQDVKPIVIPNQPVQKQVAITFPDSTASEQYTRSINTSVNNNNHVDNQSVNNRYPVIYDPHSAIMNGISESDFYTYRKAQSGYSLLIMNYICTIIAFVLVSITFYSGTTWRYIIFYGSSCIPLVFTYFIMNASSKYYSLFCTVLDIVGLADVCWYIWRMDKFRYIYIMASAFLYIFVVVLSIYSCIYYNYNTESDMKIYKKVTEKMKMNRRALLNHF
ncbi:hypothetical protein WA158_004987 [Blastocystis sp. Blastoise]